MAFLPALTFQTQKKVSPPKVESKYFIYMRRY